MPFGIPAQPGLRRKVRVFRLISYRINKISGNKINCFNKMAFFIMACFVFVFGDKGVKGFFDSCVHGGMKYKEGDYFLPNDTIIKTESPHQCVQCRCHQGLVLCEIENCPSLDCETPEEDRRFCCRRCPETVKADEESPGFFSGTISIDSGLTGKSRKDCISGGKYLKNGSVWQPVMGPFGRMACVQCRCQEGKILCARAKCADQPCSKPKRELGQCCPVCPAVAASQTAPVPPFAENNKKKVQCLSKTTELFVFKTPNVRNNSEKIEYVFLENTPGWKSGLVKIHTWNLHPKGEADVFSFRIVSRREFYDGNFQILGSISRKLFRKYSKREDKLRSNCFSNCFMKVERLENSLLDYGVNTRSKCTQDEIDVADI